MISERRVKASGENARWTRAAAAGLSFRQVSETDRPFLFRLYASTRAEELAAVPWPQEQKLSFLQMQAHAQHTDYRRNYADADWLVIVRAGEDIGRLYLHRRKRAHHIIDIAFLPEHRGKGYGGALTADLLDEAAAAGMPMDIHVEKYNPAMRLYRRLGFTTAEDQGVYDLMRWTPPPPGAQVKIDS
jgi:ribosomal protein S18 acetylase RimI-like enzyme